MRRLVAAALAALWLSIAPAAAQCIVGDQGFGDAGGILCGRKSTPAPTFTVDFTQGSLPGTITDARNSVESNGLYTDAAGSTYTDFPINTAVFQGAQGVQVYESRTNRLLHSAVPVTGTGTVTTGTTVLWCIGTGSVLTAATTAVGTGFGTQQCNPPAATQTLTIATAGSFTVTDTGSINRYQSETGTFPTPIITTVGASATRAADVITATLSSLSIPSAPTALSWVINARTAFGTGTQVLGQVDDGTNSNRVYVYRDASTNIHCVVVVAGVTQADLSLGTVANDTAFGVAFAATTNDFAASLNGAAVVTDAVGTMPTGLTIKRFGSDTTAAGYWNRTIANDTMYLSRISNAQLQAQAAL